MEQFFNSLLQVVIFKLTQVVKYELHNLGKTPLLVGIYKQ